MFEWLPGNFLKAHTCFQVSSVYGALQFVSQESRFSHVAWLCLWSQACPLEKPSLILVRIAGINQGRWVESLKTIASPEFYRGSATTRLMFNVSLLLDVSFLIIWTEETGWQVEKYNAIAMQSSRNVPGWCQSHLGTRKPIFRPSFYQCQ